MSTFDYSGTLILKGIDSNSRLDLYCASQDKEEVIKHVSQTKLAVTGATGELVSRVAARLAGAGIVQRLVVRDRKRAPQLAGTETVQASSYGDAAGMKRALAGVDTLFLVSAHDRMNFVQRSTTGVIDF